MSNPTFSAPYSPDLTAAAAAVGPTGGVRAFARYMPDACLRDREMCDIVCTILRGLEAYWFRYGNSAVTGKGLHGVGSISAVGSNGMGAI